MRGMTNNGNVFPPAIDYCGRAIRLVESSPTTDTDEYGSPARWYQDEDSVLYRASRHEGGYRVSRMSERARRMIEIRNANNRKVA